jgi:hypothetical protein
LACLRLVVCPASLLCVAALRANIVDETTTTHHQSERIYHGPFSLNNCSE